MSSRGQRVPPYPPWAPGPASSCPGTSHCSSLGEEPSVSTPYPRLTSACGLRVGANTALGPPVPTLPLGRLRFLGTAHSSWHEAAQEGPAHGTSLRVCICGDLGAQASAVLPGVCPAQGELLLTCEKVCPEQEPRGLHLRGNPPRESRWASGQLSSVSYGRWTGEHSQL